MSLFFALNKRCGIRHPTITPYASFECSDDLEILIGIQNEREWFNFCKFVLEEEKTGQAARRLTTE